MKSKKLKTFDMKTYDIELKYTKQIAPLLTKIEKLNSNHELKSLQAHKDFLANEEKSKQKLAEISVISKENEESIKSKIDGVVKNLNNKEKTIKKSLEKTIAELTSLNSKKLEEIKYERLEIEKTMDKDILSVKEKYHINVATYLEKLEAYNENFDQNKTKTKNHIEEILKELSFKTETLANDYADLKESYTLKITEASNINKENVKKINDSLIETDKRLTVTLNRIKHDTNDFLKRIKDQISVLEKEIIKSNSDMISKLTDSLNELVLLHEERVNLIKKDTDLNITALNNQFEVSKKNKDKNIQKDIKMKINLINVRQESVLDYEEKIYLYRESIIKSEIEKLKLDSYNEVRNLEKLEVFLTNDQLEIKDTGDYLRKLNLRLKSNLNDSLIHNLNYLKEHTNIRNSYLVELNSTFNDLKNDYITFNKAIIKDLAELNSEYDEIHRYLDTSEPLKEIEINQLKQDIEISEISERNNIKFAIMDHDILVLNDELKLNIKTEELNTLTKLSENNKQITDAKNKEFLESNLEKAEQKYKRAKEIAKLRNNNTLLEEKLLKSNYEKEQKVLEIEKQIALIEDELSITLENLSIKASIDNIETEANYKIEVINKHLEEEILKIDEKISKIKFNQDQFITTFEYEYNELIANLKQEIETLKDNHSEKLKLIEKAYNHEIKEPHKNILKIDAIKEDKQLKLKTTSSNFKDVLLNIQSDLVSTDYTYPELIEFIKNNRSLKISQEDYLNAMYQSLTLSTKYMYDLELNKLRHQSETTDKKLTRLIKKIKTDINQENKNIKLKQTEASKMYETLLKSKLNSLESLKQENIEIVKNETIHLLNDISEFMSKHELVITNDINQIFEPLSKLDNERIQNAKKNYDKAIANELASVNENINPKEQELKEKESKKQNEKNENIKKTNLEIEELKTQIKSLKDSALLKVKTVQTEKKELVSSYDERLNTLKTLITEKNERTTNDFEDQKADLLTKYTNKQNKLDLNKNETDKIFDYEERIYNIAKETSKSKYEDQLVKTANVHQTNIQKNNQLIEEHKNNFKRLKKEYKEDLRVKTTVYENNIFTVRPRIEEAIGDKLIDLENDIRIRKQRLIDIKSEINRLIEEINTQKLNHLHESFTKLNTTSEYGIKDYQAIYQKFSQNLLENSKTINDTIASFKNALFELSKNKHSKTVVELMKINESMK